MNDVNGEKVLVRNFVPARTKDEPQIVGLYDKVSGEFYAPRGGELELGYDEEVADAKVTISEFAEGTAAWRSGNESVTNVIDGTYFKVSKGTENVKVIFMLDPKYEFVSGESIYVYDIGTVANDVLVPELPAFRHRKVEYVDADGKVKTNDTFSVVTVNTSKLSEGWWLVEGETAVGMLTVNGTANIILMDGTTLTVNGGIRVEGENALNIYAQEAGTGTLIANGADGCAGIGGGAGWGEWIGGAGSPGGSCGRVSVYGGVVAATGGVGGAGIGGGRGGKGSKSISSHPDGYNGGKGGSGGVVTIFGGTIQAIGNGGGAGIGGGAGGSGGEGTHGSACAGGPGGDGGAGGTVMIYSGVVEAQGGVGIGGGAGGAGECWRCRRPWRHLLQRWSRGPWNSLRCIRQSRCGGRGDAGLDEGRGR